MPIDKVFIDEAGNKTLMRVGVNKATGAKEWVPVPMASTWPASEVAKSEAEDLKNVLMSKQTPVSKIREAEFRALPAIDKAMISAGRETTGLGTGTAEVGLNLAGAIADAWSQKYPWLIDYKTAAKPGQLADRLAKQRAEDTNVNREAIANQGLPGALGASLPYVLTSALAGPLARKAADSALSTVEDVAQNIGSESKTLLARGSRAAAASDIAPLKWAGNKAVTEYVEPLEKWATARKLQQPMASPFRQGTASDILGSTALGAVEGGLNADSDAKNGAMAGLFGGISGRLLKPYIEAAPRPNDQAYNEAVANRTARGRVPLPGEVLDDPALQSEEHAMRSHDNYSRLLKQHDLANQKVDNRDAYAAMGVDTGATSMTPAQLSEHLANVSEQYKTLEAQSKARLEPADLAELRSHTMSLAGGISDEAVKASKVAQEYYKKFTALRDSQKVNRASNGRMQPGVVDGTAWQNLRSELKEDIASYRDKGDNKSVDALRPFLTKIDTALEKGITKLGGSPEEGTALVGKWKDLNEQYAMGKLLMNHGLDAFGDVNPTRLNSYFMTNDPERYLQGKGGRVKTLFDIARLAPIEKRQAGSSLSGLNMTEVGVEPKRTEREIFMSTPARLMPKALSEAYFRMYRRGYPGVTGLVPGMNGKDFGNTGLYTRSLAQGSQVHPAIINGIADTASGVRDFMDHPQLTIQEMIKKLLSSKE